MLLTTVFCQGQSGSGYQVLGQVAGLPDGTKVYLIDGGRRKAIDSATVKQEQFILKGNLTEPAYMYLHAGRGRASKKLADILLDNRIVYVKGNKPEYDSITVSGSDIDQYWREWYEADQRVAYQRYKIKQVCESLATKKDTANANVLGKLIQEMQLERINLLKAYVKRRHDSAAGAVLPTLCTLGGDLTRADYMEMYNTLTPTWQQSSFGKEILAEAKKKKDVPAFSK
jgi:hypothetical protein